MIQLGDEESWSNIGLRVFMNTVSHPIEYGKVLIQIGYEPFPPRETYTWFGRPALKLPNIFEYVGHIYAVDGFCGCYRGLVPKLCAYTLNSIAYEKTTQYISDLKICEHDPAAPVCTQDSSEPKCKKALAELIRGLIRKTVAILVSHPMEVIAVRMMAQFVGRETKYTGLFGSFAEVYRQNGMMGFYSGLMPRLLGSAATLILVDASTFILNKYFIRDRDMLVLVTSSMKFIATTVTYPFSLVSYCMKVNNSGLVAGSPPRMPVYDNWIDCWHHLSANGQLKRGSSLLWRYYTGPSVTINGRPVALDIDTYARKNAKGSSNRDA